MKQSVTRRTVMAAGAMGISMTSPSSAHAEGVRPFQLSIADPVINDLRERLARARFSDALPGDAWEYGINPDLLRALAAYWASGFDWAALERGLNALPQFTAQVEGQELHFIHQRAANGAGKPVLMLHGWPSSFVQFEEIIPILATRGFDVVALSLPGYPGSAPAAQAGMSVRRIAELAHELMIRLGYARYAGRGSDLGAGVLQQLALARPDSVTALHLSGTNPYVAQAPDNPTPAEQEFLQRAQAWMQSEMAYAMMHASKPNTVAQALNDSPIGLAAWILEKFHRWTDEPERFVERYGRDRLLANLTLYWATQSAGPSMRLYAETVRDQNALWGRVETPTAMLMTSKDMFPTPREWAARSYNVVRWTEIDRGGHFLEWEEPELVADDMAAFLLA